MTTKANLYQGILEEPDNDELRLIYADWCDENDDSERAEFIRIQIQLEDLGEYDDQYFDLKEREEELLVSHASRWTDEIRQELFRIGIDASDLNYHFQRGFVEFLTPYKVWWPRLAMVRWIIPIGSPRWMCERKDQFEQIVKGDGVVRLRSLAIKGSKVPARKLAKLLKSDLSRCVRKLDFVDGGVDSQTVIYAVAVSRHLTQLRDLNLSRTSLDDMAISALTKSPNVAKVRSLNLGWAHLRDTGFSAIAESTQLSQLQFLNVWANDITSASLHAFSTFGGPGQLRELQMSYNTIGDDGAIALAHSTRLTKLQKLHAWRVGLGAKGAAALAESEFLGQLRELVCPCNAMQDRGATALARSTKLRMLSILDLSENNIGSQGARAFARALEKYLPNLRLLCLMGNPIPPKACRILKRAAECRGVEVHLDE
ncbi:MAG: TIGR02996 domain-containing protein [Gemmataceae bacterium]